MKNYQYKYSKYKNKYSDLRNNLQNNFGGGNAFLSNSSSEDSLISLNEQQFDKSNYLYLDKIIIYPNISIVTKIIKTNEQLLDGFIEDSIMFTNDDGIIHTSSFIKGTNSPEDVIRKEIIITQEDDTQITGILESFDSKMITINKDNKLIFIKKWKNAKMASDINSKPIFMNNIEGRLQYMVSSIGWNPIYNLFLNSDDTDNISGTLYFMAFINNLSGYELESKSLVLVAGDSLIQTNNKSNKKTYKSSYRTIIESSEQSNGQKQNFTELVTFDLKKQSGIKEKMFLPIKTYNLKKIKKIYSINTENYDQLQKQFISADYGYKILIENTDFPAGLFRLFTKSHADNSSLLLGSIFIDRTPQNVPIEIILGKTSRIRVNLSKESKFMEIIEKQQIKKNRLWGTITNDTKKIQDLIIKEYIGERTLIFSDIEPIIKMGYLQWIFQIKPGITDFKINYQTQY